MKIAFVLSACAKSGPFIVANEIINTIYNKVDIIDIFYLVETEGKLDFKANCKKVSLFGKTDFSKYDIVHSHGFLGDVYLYLNRNSVTGMSLTTLHQKIKPDYTMSYNWIIASMLEKFWCWCIKDRNCIVTLTNEMAQYYQAILKKRIHYVYNGISPIVSTNIIPEYKEIMSLKNQYSIMGISANLIYRKGIDKVVRALSMPGAENLALMVLGDGEEKKELLKIAAQLGVANRCVFLGYKINAIDYYKYFDVYMMSSRSEGFGLCVIEAASQKIPIVCNDLSVFRELFENKEVVRFNLDDNSSMIGAVKEALLNRKLLSDVVYNKYLECFTTKKMADNYLQLYSKLKENIEL